MRAAISSGWLESPPHTYVRAEGRAALDSGDGQPYIS